jgi:CrcB protein
MLYHLFLNFVSDPCGDIYLGPHSRLFLLVGVCVGYTTYSSFRLVSSALFGVFCGLLMHVSNRSIATALPQLLRVGICGGLTTLSSFSLQTYNLIVDGRWLSALSNIVFLTGLSLGCVALGWPTTQGIDF